MDFSLRKKRSGATKISKFKISDPSPVNIPQHATSNAIKITKPRKGNLLSRGVPQPTLPIIRGPGQRELSRTADMVKRRSTRFGPMELPRLPQDPTPKLSSKPPGQVPPSRLRELSVADGTASGGGFGSVSSGGIGGGGGGSVGGGSIGGFGPGGSMSSTATARPRGTELTIDMDKLQDPKLDPEVYTEYMTTLLAHASESDIVRFKTQLKQKREEADLDLQRSVYRYRDQFINVGKEAAIVKSGVRTLRFLTNELTGTLAQFAVTDESVASNANLASYGLSSPASAGARGFNRRTSVHNLEALWNSQLQELWRRVEGSQKWLPAIPGRHVVYESRRWVELNSASLKTKRKVHLILLNDHFLIATEGKQVADSSSKDKQRQQQQQQQQSSNPNVPLVAMHCWPLQDVQIADLNMKVKPGLLFDNHPTGNAINIRITTEQAPLVMVSKEVEQKDKLLDSYRQASEDLRRNLESEMQKETEEGDSSSEQDKMYAAGLQGIGSPFLKSAFMTNSAGAGVGGLSSKGDVTVEIGDKPVLLRKLYAKLDSLDIHIALQGFQEAVDLAAELRANAKAMRSNAPVQALVTAKLDDSVSRLAGLLCRFMVEKNSWKTTVCRHVDWLRTLGYENQAREAYLDARSDMLKARVRRVIFEGDLHVYIYQISYIYFTVIKHTVNIFQSGFPPPMMSACVKWAKLHVDDFNALLERQLSSVDPAGQVYKDCMERTRLHAEMLNEAGIDFKHMVGVSAMWTERALRPAEKAS